MNESGSSSMPPDRSHLLTEQRNPRSMNLHELSVGEIVELIGPQAPVLHAAGRYARGQFDPPQRFDLVFLARDVPALGYRTYRIEAGRSASNSSGIEVGKHSLENCFFRIALDPRTGAVRSLYDKELGRELVDPDAPHRFNQGENEK